MAILAWALPAFCEGACLSPAVGDAISARLEDHALERALAPGWSLEGVNVWPEQVVVHVTDPRGGKVDVELHAGKAAGAGADATGKWFGFFVRAGTVEVSPPDRRSLLGLAATVEAAIPEETIDAGCRKGVGSRQWVELGGNVSRRLALTAAILEIIAIVAGLLFIRHRWRGRRVESAGTFGPVEKLSMLAGVLVGLVPWADPFARLWQDTINDQRDAAWCLGKDLCTSLGESASVPGIHHAVSWFHLRTLMMWLGTSVDGSLRLMYALDGAAVLLLACAVARSAGRRAGAVTLVAGAVGTYFVVQPLVLNNCIALPCAGVVLLVVGAEAVRRPTTLAFVLAGLAAAVVANVHAAAALSGASVLAMGLLAPERKGAMALAGTGAFVLATTAIAPACWTSNAIHAWQGAMAWASGAHASPAVGAGRGVVASAAVLGLCLAGILAGRQKPWAEASLLRAAAAVALPALAVALGASVGGRVRMEVRYVGFAVPAIAVLAAFAIDGVFRRLLGGTGGTWEHRLLPYVAALCAADVSATVLPGSGPFSTGAALPTSPLASDLTFADVAGLPSALASRGWTYANVYRNLKSPASAEILESIGVLAPDYPLGPAGADPSNAYVLKVPAERVPSPLPPDWTLLRRHGLSATLLVVTRTAIDWSRFESCDPLAQRCTGSGLAPGDADIPRCAYCVEGMPPFGRLPPVQLELRIPLRQTPAALPWSIVMPRADRFCEGRIARVEGRDAVVSDDGQQATWAGSAGDAPQGAVLIDWELHSPRCDGFSYTGLPPFVLEGDRDSVARLEELVQ
jgi:hypothetical protein